RAAPAGWNPFRLVITNAGVVETFPLIGAAAKTDTAASSNSAGNSNTVASEDTGESRVTGAVMKRPISCDSDGWAVAPRSYGRRCKTQPHGRQTPARTSWPRQ